MINIRGKCCAHQIASAIMIAAKHSDLLCDKEIEDMSCTGRTKKKKTSFEEPKMPGWGFFS